MSKHNTDEIIDESMVVVPSPLTSGKKLSREIDTFWGKYTDFLASHGLPTESVVADVDERRTVINNFATVLKHYPEGQLSSAVYISKFVGAVAAGLFDAALNYMWDETVRILRRRVAEAGLDTFYDICIGGKKRDEFKSEQDLNKISDSQLVQGAQELELISEVCAAQLTHILYMRNYASAAHPNQSELNGLQLAHYLDTCIKEVAALSPSDPAISIPVLLKGIKSDKYNESALNLIIEKLPDMHRNKLISLSNGLLQIYCRDETAPGARLNIRTLMTPLWKLLDDQSRKDLGVRCVKFSLDGEGDAHEKALELLDHVDGRSYLPDDVRAAEIRAVLDELMEAHRSMGNFYSEPPLARNLSSLVGKLGEIPSEIEAYYINVLINVYLTNGYGTAFNAEPVYRELLAKFSPEQANAAVISFMRPDIDMKLHTQLCVDKYLAMLNLLRPIAAQSELKTFIDHVLATCKKPSDFKNLKNSQQTNALITALRRLKKL
ncbi:MAG: hypothetical protein IJ228_08580 [Succinivibrio sp.]|nr:hypothetical protein [Succinivibrio sp.]